MIVSTCQQMKRTNYDGCNGYITDMSQWLCENVVVKTFFLFHVVYKMYLEKNIKA